jgi:pimeloyl-ACP methyl ester carboxylesterase
MSTRVEETVDVPGGWCLAVLDRPLGRPRGLVVCAHGLTGDRSGPADLLARWSWSLSEHAIATVRFDFRGSGESSGRFEATTFAGMVSDVCAVGRWAISMVGPAPVVTAGISIGGVPAALAAGPLNAAATLLLSSDLIEDVRFDTESITAIRSGEFHLPATFFRERENLHPRKSLVDRSRPWGLIYGVEDAKLRKAAEEIALLGARVTAIPHTGHLFESEPARASLAQATLRFLDEVLSEG